MAKKSAGGKFGKFVTDKKYRPFLIGGVIVIGAILLLSLIRPKAGSNVPAGTAVPGGPSEQAQLAMAGMALEEARFTTQANVANTQSSAALEAVRLETEAASRVMERQLDTQTQLGLASIEAEKFAKAIEAQIAFGNQAAAVTVGLADIRANRDVSLAGISAEKTVALTSIQSTHDERMYGLAKAKRKHVGAILAGESPELGTKTKSIIGGITSLGGLLSDLRVKDDVKWSGVRDGQNWYTYYNERTGSIDAGVMSNEISPEFLMPMGSLMGVDYRALTAEGAMASG